MLNKALPLLAIILFFGGSSFSHRALVSPDIKRFPAQESSFQRQKFERLKPSEVLFGIEYSFQDQEIVEEPGRMTFRTEHKFKKFNELFAAYEQKLGSNKIEITEDTTGGSFKPGYKFNVLGDGVYTINMEPVTIEINTTPKTIDQIVETSSKIFEAAKEVQLSPYVNAAAERSGMGHIHVGGRRLMDSPLFQNSTLLRNLLVYYHKHPSLLYGFAEAYDIGDNSNIETFHKANRQIAFQAAVEEFDKWYLKSDANRETAGQGLMMFLKILKSHEPPGDREFFHHYRVLNMEHLKQLDLGAISPEKEGKFTLEHRSFRPQKDAMTAHANAELLLDLYETLSDPDYLEPFEYIDEAKFKRFWTATAIEEDWKQVRKFIRHQNKYSDAMIEETIDALDVKSPLRLSHIPEAKLYLAFSKKEDKGRAFELKVHSNEGEPFVELKGKKLPFESYQIGNETYWVSYFNVSDYGLNPNDLVDSEILVYRGNLGVDSCNVMLQNIMAI